MVLIPESGRLADRPLPRLLIDLHRARFEGTVCFERERVEKTVQFHAGVPIFAESNLRSESLANQLLQDGAISREDHARLLDAVAERGCKEGRAALELDLAPASEVFRALKEQVRVRLLECFAWEEGSFRVLPGEAPPDGAQAFRADFFELIREGIATRWGSDRILADLAPRMQQVATRIPALDAVTERLRSDPEVGDVLDAIDGNRTLWQVLERASTPRALATAWLLDALGALRYANADDEDDANAADAAPEIEIVLEDATASAAEEQPEASRPERERKPAPDGASESRLRDEITSKFSRLGEIDHYALLGVDAQASPADIKRAYLTAAKDYHPDALARRGIDGEARAQASRVFAAIGTAYATLSRADRRRDYDAQLAGDDLGANAEQIAMAETLYRKGEILLRQGNFRGALEFLLPAIELYANEADYQNAAGWALYKQPRSEPERARTHLEQATALAPEDAMAHFRLGLVLRSLGETKASETSLARARELDPNVG